MSDNQEIHVEDLCTEKKYFSQIPNIIHKMGLGPYIVAYYCLLKSIAGEKNSCFMSQKNLCKMIGCSDFQMRTMNNFMSKGFEVLGGKPLIKITHRKDENGQSLPNLIQVVDIWFENILALKNKVIIPQTTLPKKVKKIKKNNTPEPGSGGTEPGSGGTEPGSDKEEPKYNNPVKKNAFKDLGNQTGAVHKNEIKNLDAARRWKLTDEQNETFQTLKALNIDAEDKKLCYWAKTYSVSRLLEVYNESLFQKANSLKNYMSNLLDGNKSVPNANCESNRQFAEDYFKENPNYTVKFYKKYIKISYGKDYIEFDLNQNPNEFIKRIIEKLG